MQLYRVPCPVRPCPVPSKPTTSLSHCMLGLPTPSSSLSGTIASFETAGNCFRPNCYGMMCHAKWHAARKMKGIEIIDPKSTGAKGYVCPGQITRCPCGFGAYAALTPQSCPMHIVRLACRWIGARFSRIHFPLTYLHRVSKKSSTRTLVHIFAKYWPIIIIRSPTHSVGNLQ